MSSCTTAPECQSVNRRCNLPVFAMNCETGFFDLSLSDCEVKTDCQIQSQIIMVLFAKARDNSRSECDRGGWWGGDIGSRLWTLRDTAIANPDETINQAEQYMAEALQPLIDSGIISEVNVNASIVDGKVKFDCIDIIRPEGRNNFSYLWDEGCS